MRQVAAVLRVSLCHKFHFRVGKHLFAKGGQQVLGCLLDLVYRSGCVHGAEVRADNVGSDSFFQGLHLLV